MTTWIQKAVVLALHEEQLSEHGGPSGIRDEGLLDSALARPINLEAHEQSDVAVLAASYAFGLTRNHPFIDGNKRVSLVTTELFLDLNGYSLEAGDMDCLRMWLGLSDGSISEEEMARWLRANCRPVR